MLSLLPALLLGALLRLAAPATLSGHLDHAPAANSVRLEYGRHYGSKAVKAALSPAGHELKQKFEGRDVTFVSISEGDKTDKWQRVLTAQHLTGPNSIHLHSPDNDLATRYQVSSYPTYWLIGRDGRISTRTAPRPSTGETAGAAITAALGQ